MVRILLAIALLVLALPAKAVTYYVATTGNDANPGTEAQPFRWPQACVDAMSAGDTCIVKAGTYSGNDADVLVANKAGTSTNRITLRAENPAVDCADPEGDPDGCELNLTARTILSGGAEITIRNNADWWSIEGFEITGGNELFECLGDGLGNGPENNRARFIHYDNNIDTGRSDIQFDFSYCINFTLEHSAITSSDPGGYSVRLWAGTSGFTMRNVYCAGRSFCINMRLLAGPNITLERLVSEGQNKPFDFGPHYDRTAAHGTNGGGTSCAGALLTDGTSATIFDATIQNITARRLFARSATYGATNLPIRQGIIIANVRNLLIEGAFIANPSHASTPTVGLRTEGDFAPSGVCGVEPGENVVRGLIVVNPLSGQPCMSLAGNGYDSNNLRIENFVCHNASKGATFAGWPVRDSNCRVPPYEDCSVHPTTIMRNGVFNDGSTVLSGHASSRLTYSHNDVLNFGTPPTEEGNNLTADPQFVGPETVSTPDLSTKLVDGATLWNWDGVGGYQEIISQFETQQASLVDAGTGNDSPCTGASCDIGANEFIFELPSDLWESCAVYGNGDTVFGSFANPWIAGRNGLVIDVDCNQKRFVIGRCDDPTAEATCDTDIYIHKAAQVRSKRVNEAITLSTGTSASSADTSGVCWRTRATLDFTESLEDLTGIWVRYEVDPDGGTHDCTCIGAECPPWAWQGAQ